MIVRPGCYPIFVLFLAASFPAQSQEEDAERLFATACAICHGPEGHGDKTKMAPSIAHLPYWYVQIQLQKFREGKRGADAKDPFGIQMRAMALALTEEQILGVARYINALSSRSIEALDEGGDLRSGEEIYRDHCAACHRYNGHGEKVFRSPPLTGLSNWYVRAQFEKFREGQRGRHEEDLDGAKMRDIASILSPEAEQDLILFLSELARKYPLDQRNTR